MKKQLYKTSFMDPFGDVHLKNQVDSLMKEETMYERSNGYFIKNIGMIKLNDLLKKESQRLCQK